MAITSITAVAVDQAEYSRYYRTPIAAVDYGLITATVTGVTGLVGDILYVALVSPRYGVVATKAYSLATTAQVATFDLDIDCLDEDGIYRAAQGSYTVVAANTADLAGVHKASAPFLITVAHAEELKNVWLGTIPLNVEHTRSVTIEGITGVVGTTTREVQRGGYPITWDVSDRALSWDGGPPYLVGLGVTSPIKARLWNRTLDQTIDVAIDPTAVPASDVLNGYVFVDWGQIADTKLRADLSTAYAYLITNLLVPLEPQYVCTPLLKAQYPYAVRIVDAPEFRRASGITQPTTIDLPIRRVLRLHEIGGWYGTGQSVVLSDTMLTVDAFNGSVQITPGYVPFYPAPTPLTVTGGYLGLGGGYYGNRNLPGFWQFAATWGLPNLRDDSAAGTVREGILRYAAVTALLVAGRAQTSLVASEAFNRDGASYSRNYTGGQYGLYSDMIQEHLQWFGENSLKMLRRRLIGIRVSRG